MKSLYLMAGLLAAAATAGGQEVEQNTEQVSMTLALAAPPAGNAVRLRVEIENRSTQPVLVPRAVASMDRLLGNVFIVKETVTGEPVGYQGPMVKRGPLTAADYLALAPGQRHAHVIDIGPAYAFKPGTHTYTVAYAGHYVRDAKALTGAGAPGLPLEAPAVTFSYSR